MLSCHRRTTLYVYAFAAFFGIVQSRAVNISNTWMLPEEGFSVFYRYFRDRISWYEADAVCQFHHANLVTADNTSQYDAIRAYLKELDITEKVWIGLSKSPEKSTFMWTDFRSLSNEGHWEESLPSSGDSQSLCAVMDPAADFLWRVLPCGGPEVAAFICELPIPSWAVGPRGCLLTELPSLTVLYVPEQSALELTSDCGLDGTKRIACKGNADHEEMLKQLTCLIPTEDVDEDKPSKSSTSDYFETSSSTWDDNSVADSGKTTKSWTSNTVVADYGSSTRHRRETEDSLSSVSTTKSSFKQTSSPANLSWQDTHKEKTVLTTEKIVSLDMVTPTPATISSAVVLTSTTSATVKDGGAIKKLDQKIIHSTTAQPSATNSTSEPFSTVTSSTVTSSKAVSKPIPTAKVSTMQPTIDGTSSAGTVTAQEVSGEEYPGAINQGQLFTIIENGTMFDLIELNETEQKQQQSVTPTSISVTESPPTKKPTNKKKPILLEKKKDVLVKRLTTTESPTSTKHILSVDEMEENLTKEFEMMPDIKDTSIKLSRTFRKELPPLKEEEHGNLEKGSQFGVPRIVAFTVVNEVDDSTDSFQGDQPGVEGNNTLIPEKNSQERDAGTKPLIAVNPPKSNQTNDEHFEVSKRTVPVSENPVDPRIYMVNHHLGHHENHSIEHEHHFYDLPFNNTEHNPHNIEHNPHNVAHNMHNFTITTVNTTTEPPKLSKKDFLPKSLLGEDTQLASSSHGHPTPATVNISESYSEHPFPSDEPKKQDVGLNGW